MDNSFTPLICEENQEVHVYPLFGREHEFEGLSCWCHPERDVAEPRVVVHNVAN